MSEGLQNWGLSWVVMAVIFVLLMGAANDAAIGIPSSSRKGMPLRIMSPSACTEVVALYPELANNSSASPGSFNSKIADMFWTVCQTPEFSALVEKWGAQNFSLGFGLQSGVATTAYYGIRWQSVCTDSSLVGLGECTYNEYWTGNISSAGVTGPVVVQYPTIYEGPNGFQAPTLTFLGLPLSALLIVIALVAAAALVGVILVHRSRRTASVSIPEEDLGNLHETDSAEAGHRNGELAAGAVGEEPTTAGTNDSLDDVF